MTNGDMDGFDNGFYVTWGLFITVMVLITNILEGMMLNYILLQINTNIHKLMLLKVTNSIVSFFDLTPIGTILNRFSNDIGMLDRQNQQTISAVLWGTMNLTFMIGTICYVNPLVLIPAFIVFIALIYLRKAFSKPSLESKRLDLASRSPLYSEISSTLNGLVIIRVFRQGGRFIRNFYDTIYNNFKCMLFMQRVQGVFGLLIDILLYILTVSGIFLYIHISLTTEIEPGLFGLALVLLLDLCNSSSWVVKQSLQLDVNM